MASILKIKIIFYGGYWGISQTGGKRLFCSLVLPSGNAYIARWQWNDWLLTLHLILLALLCFLKKIVCPVKPVGVGFCCITTIPRSLALAASQNLLYYTWPFGKQRYCSLENLIHSISWPRCPILLSLSTLVKHASNLHSFLPVVIWWGDAKTTFQIRKFWPWPSYFHKTNTILKLWTQAKSNSLCYDCNPYRYEKTQ